MPRTARGKRRHLEITSLNGCAISSLDIGYLCVDDEGVDSLIDKRVSDDWILDVSKQLSECERFGFERPAFIISEYANTDRAPRNTFAKRHTKRLLPLRFRVIEPIYHTEKDLRAYSEHLSLSPQGAVCVKVVCEQINESVSVAEIIDQWNLFLRKAPDLLIDVFADFSRLWNASVSSPIIKPPTRELLEEAVYTYEVMDFNFRFYGDPACEIGSVKALYTDRDPIPACELAAISKMSPASAAALRDTRLNDFIVTDLGARDDELWSVSRERMVRRHPARANPHNRAFFNDIKTAVEILVAQQAVADYLEDWTGRKRKVVLDELLHHVTLTSTARESFQKQVVSLTKVGQLLVEPIMLQRNVHHSFYVRVVSKLTECLELSACNDRASRALRNFSELVQSAANFNLGVLSADLATNQVALASSARKIGIATVWITVLATLLAIMQFYTALAPQKGSTDKSSDIQFEKSVPIDE